MSTRNGPLHLGLYESCNVGPVLLGADVNIGGGGKPADDIAVVAASEENLDDIWRGPHDVVKCLEQPMSRVRVALVESVDNDSGRIVLENLENESDGQLRRRLLAVRLRLAHVLVQVDEGLVQRPRRFVTAELARNAAQYLVRVGPLRLGGVARAVEVGKRGRLLVRLGRPFPPLQFSIDDGGSIV